MNEKRCRRCDRRVRFFPGIAVVVVMVVLVVGLRVVEFLSDVEQQMHTHRVPS